MKSARYYMAARGLSPEMAKRLLVQAFVGDAFVALEDEEESERLPSMRRGRRQAGQGCECDAALERARRTFPVL